MQNRLTVTIAGQQFSLVADESEKDMKEIAELASKKIAEAKRLVGSSTFSTGVLATLNMADEAVKLRRQCDQYKIQTEDQQREIARQTEALGQLNDQLETLRNAKSGQDPALLLTEVKRLEKELSNATSLHDNVCAETDAEIARLSAEIDRLTQAEQQARAQIVDTAPLERQIKALTKQTEQLREALKKAQQEKEIAVHEQENSMQSEIEQLNAALKALHMRESEQSARAKGQIETLTKEVEELRSKRVNTEALYAEIKSLQAALDAKEQQVAENARLRERVEELTHKIKQNDPAPLHEEIFNLRTELDGKEQQMEENAQLKAKVSDLGEQLRRNDPAPLYAEIRNLNKALEEARQQIVQNAHLREEMQRLRDSYHDVRPVEEFEQISQQLEQVQQELSKAKMQLAGREIGEIGELRREMTRLRELEKNYEDPAPLHSKIEQLKAALKQAKKAQPATDEALQEELKRVKKELNRQIQINQSMKKKKGGR